MKRIWRWALDELGGQGLFIMLTLCVPMATYIYFWAVWPLQDRIWGAVMVLFVGTVMGRMRRSEDRKKEAVERARIEALRIVERLELRGKGLESATLEELHAIRRGLKGEPHEDAVDKRR